MQAPHVGATFAHHLAVALGRAHRNKVDFFLEQLLVAKPLLAGYAFKSLIRASPSLQLKDLPDEILDRSDEIPTMWADMGDSVPVGKFVKRYFVQRHVNDGIRKNDINDVWVKKLTELGDLSDMPLCINLRFSQVTDAGLGLLVSQIRIQSLVLDFVPITDAGLKHLKGLTEIDFLSLSGTQITDKALVYLKGLTSLETLDLENTLVTKGAVNELRQAIPNCEIHC